MVVNLDNFIIHKMDLISLLVALISLLYILLIVFFTAGWIRKRNFIISSNESLTFISVIVAVRNEEKQINFLLEALI